MITTNVNNTLLNSDYNASGGIKDVTDRELFAKIVNGKFNSAGVSTSEYISHLKQKYGSVTIKSVGRTQAELDAVGKSMGGSDVIIAPNMVEKMAADPELANYYESKIDKFFADEPKMQKIFAAKGLTYEVCGAVVHEDGTLTLICGGGDTPERVAQVNKINRERDEARSAQRKLYFEKSRQSAEQRRRDYKAAAEKEYEESLAANLYYVLKEQIKYAQPDTDANISKYLFLTESIQK